MYTSRSTRRDSHPHSSNRQQRPRLLRSTATEPSITASNSFQASLVSPSSPQRATDLLNAIYPSSTPCGMSSESIVHHSQPVTIIDRDNRGETDSAEMSRLSSSLSLSDCYFSFPSFDNWESPKAEGEKDSYS
ncbi:unnamed protein product [Clonostachys rosea]|uniref:Uncharacterized protein n=1 Tax=Bionectria ochroleuca TaxID=29856 RepID=A0ABY6TW28_BIOOC|nr:unnamed protein product [Clonostachys rosea]